MADSEIEDDDESVEYAGEENEDGVSQVWIDSLFDDLETAHYSCGAVVFPACGIGSPHIRLRTWFVAERSFETVGDSIGSGLEGYGRFGEVADQEGRQGAERYGSKAGGFDGLDNSNGRGCSERELGNEAGSECAASGGRPERGEGCWWNDAADAVGSPGVANASGERRQQVTRSAPSDEAENGREGRIGCEPNRDNITSSNGESIRLADSEYAERRQEHVNGEDGRDRQDSGRQETHGESGACGEVLGMVNAEIGGERSYSGESQEGAQSPEPYRGRSVPNGVVDSSNERSERREGTGWEAQRRTEHTGVSSGLADSTTDGRGEERPISGRIGAGDGEEGRAAGLDAGSIAGGNAGAEREQRSGQQRLQPQDDLFGGEGYCGIGHNGGPGLQGSNPTDGFWGNPDWLFCRDGKWRPVESGITALAHGLPRGMGTLSPELRGLAEMAGLDGKSLARAKKFRIGSLKGYGNAIVSDVAVEIIKAYMEYADERS